MVRHTSNCEQSQGMANEVHEREKWRDEGKKKKKHGKSGGKRKVKTGSEEEMVQQGFGVGGGGARKVGSIKRTRKRCERKKTEERVDW